LIYDPTYLHDVLGVSPYRYFPAELFVFSLYAMLDLATAHVAFAATNIFLAILTSFYCARCIILLEKRGKGTSHDPGMHFSIEKYVLAYFLLPFQVTSLGMGQISCFVAFFTIAGFHAMLSGNKMMGCLLVGMSIVFKPVAIFIAILVVLDRKVKVLFKNVAFVLLPLALDIIMFLAVPGLLRGFITLNLSEANLSREALDPSISISYLVSFILQVPAFNVMVVFAGIVLISALWVRSRLRDGQQQVVFGFIFGMIAFFIVQPDIWDTQLVFLYPFLAIAFTFMERPSKHRSLFISYLLYPFVSMLLIFPELRVLLLPILASWLLLLFMIYLRNQIKGDFTGSGLVQKEGTNGKKAG
jgi:hypothetical protein